mgnify:CR=1 FL=1
MGLFDIFKKKTAESAPKNDYEDLRNFERDLIHCEDCGTMTHWYSQTLSDCLGNDSR